MLLRGCYLRNIDYCVGLVIYVGAESKIMKNAKKPPKKVSAIMTMMNYMLYSVFAFQLLLIGTYAGISVSWTNNEGQVAKYLNLPGGAGGLTAFYSVLTFWVAYSHLIPISLNVAIEVLKLTQGALVGRDAKMYDAETEKYALSRTSDLIEELGQVDFVFSDKTGTLTQNKMMFRKCSVNGVIYGEGEGEALRMLPQSV
jgi:magnesium-transporting ATPase (P-type)